MHIGDRLLRMSKAEAVSFFEETGEREADMPVTMLNAIEAARTSFEGWSNLLGVIQARYIAAASTAIVVGRTASPNPKEA
ncbi:hypothetical protein MKK64_10275 [Methylobacterium sp. E-025]|uniref:hypothetical protein n=1 Tax=Methylobacterium sp. E-025 TaxID=2836561 RepID=UPI001FBA3D3C|nr:hypothetical protein [Methylobacterium sp. E-025]MCJ2111578.1 hypothetical protein [Methylobacterium sp. E-025]